MNQPDDLQKFVYALSHDMGAPLRAVAQFSGLIERHVRDKLDEKEAFWLELIRDNADQAQKMLDALLTYSRLSTKASPHQTFSLLDLTQQVVDAYRQRLDASGGHITIDNTLPTVEGSVDQWRFMLRCLIDNALYFQPQEEPHCPQVLIRNSATDREICLAVEDNGIGVAETQWDDIVLPFKRLQDQRLYPSVGMGLTYCEKICQLHGKKLSFELSSLGGLTVAVRNSSQFPTSATDKK